MSFVIVHNATIETEIVPGILLAAGAVTDNVRGYGIEGSLGDG